MGREKTPREEERAVWCTRRKEGAEPYSLFPTFYFSLHALSLFSFYNVHIGNFFLIKVHIGI